jgi:hypothetical protein
VANVNPTTGAVIPVPTGEARFAINHYILAGEEWVEHGSTTTQTILTGASDKTVQLNFQITPALERVHVGSYHAYSISATSTVNRLDLRITCGFRHDTPTYAHLSIPHLYDKRDVVGALRPVAAAAMLSPNSATFQRQGLVRGLQLPPGQTWMTAAAGGFNALNSAEGMWNGPWEKGIYGFLKPVGINEFEMRSPFLRLGDMGPNSPVVDVEYPLVAPGGTLVFYAKTDLQTLGSGDVLYAAGQSYTTALRCLEFRTVDTWFKQDVPKLDQEELEIAMRMITHLPQFHENPLHIAAITGFLKAARFAGELALKHWPRIVQAVPIIHEAARRITAGFAHRERAPPREARPGPRVRAPMLPPTAPPTLQPPRLMRVPSVGAWLQARKRRTHTPKAKPKRPSRQPRPAKGRGKTN